MKWRVGLDEMPNNIGIENALAAFRPATIDAGGT